MRKFGNRIRITAQLIEADSDIHLWSDTYDRELDDLFAIQDEISSAIVEALKSKLGLEVKLDYRDMSTVNLEAHSEYLQGRSLVEKRTKEDLENALIHFNKAIEIEPKYALAWMGKSWAIGFLSEKSYGDIPADIALSKSRLAADMALSFDPDTPTELTKRSNKWL